MEIEEMSDREFRITLLKKFSELQQNRNRWLNRIRKIMREQNEKFNKEIETIKNNQTGIQELKIGRKYL